MILNKTYSVISVGISFIQRKKLSEYQRIDEVQIQLGTTLV